MTLQVLRVPQRSQKTAAADRKVPPGNDDSDFGHAAMQTLPLHSIAPKCPHQVSCAICLEELGRVKGHFGPINTVSFSPDGKQYVSGGEDGFVRLHDLDPDYFTRGQEGLVYFVCILYRKYLTTLRPDGLR